MKKFDEKTPDCLKKVLILEGLKSIFTEYSSKIDFLEEVYEIWITKYLFSGKVLYEFRLPQPFKVSRICYNFLVSTISLKIQRCSL